MPLTCFTCQFSVFHLVVEDFHGSTAGLLRHVPPCSCTMLTAASCHLKSRHSERSDTQPAGSVEGLGEQPYLDNLEGRNHSSADAPTKGELAQTNYLWLQASVKNLGEQPYLDNLDGRNRRSQPAGPLAFDREVDRIFVGAPPDIKVQRTWKRDLNIWQWETCMMSMPRKACMHLICWCVARRQGTGASIRNARRSHVSR